MLCSQVGGSAPTTVTDRPTHTPRNGSEEKTAAPAWPVLLHGIYTTLWDAPVLEAEPHQQTAPIYNLVQLIAANKQL